MACALTAPSMKFLLATIIVFSFLLPCFLQEEMQSRQIRITTVLFEPASSSHVEDFIYQVCRQEMIITLIFKIPNE